MWICVSYLFSDVLGGTHFFAFKWIGKFVTINFCWPQARQAIGNVCSDGGDGFVVVTRFQFYFWTSFDMFRFTFSRIHGVGKVNAHNCALCNKIRTASTYMFDSHGIRGVNVLDTEQIKWNLKQRKLMERRSNAKRTQWAKWLSAVYF